MLLNMSDSRLLVSTLRFQHRFAPPRNATFGCSGQGNARSPRRAGPEGTLTWGSPALLVPPPRCAPTPGGRPSTALTGASTPSLARRRREARLPTRHRPSLASASLPGRRPRSPAGYLRSLPQALGVTGPAGVSGAHLHEGPPVPPGRAPAPEGTGMREDVEVRLPQPAPHLGAAWSRSVAGGREGATGEEPLHCCGRLATRHRLPAPRPAHA